MDHFRQGMAVLAEMLGDARAEAIRSRFHVLSPVFEQEAVAVVFGRTWNREVLDRKTRALVSIGILAAQGRASALRIVFELAIRNGASLDEITEALLQVGIYAGYPAALDALTALEDVLTGLAPVPTGEAGLGSARG